ncbi:UPAR/Ly6 domain-containing protein bou isoform X2 [Periplaneta americana]|uniref:UPAR/Ly6 domain-containing protein bou isoform X2 n=1 Tax=Periplaneta americana TaxID=6978 RepID=UPI0037E772AF
MRMGVSTFMDNIVIISALLAVLIKTAMGIDCYQCTSTKSIDCTDNMIHDGTLNAANCNHVFEASYCVKTVNLYGGGLGTKRFCSALDLGNYCNYIKQPGDQLEYRSCVYTCSSDGCNPADWKRPHHLVTLIGVALLTVLAVLL